MNKRFFLSILLTLAIVKLDVNAQSSTTDEGVVINDVKWATRNVDSPETFAANPENTGMFYQWNRKVAWPATGDVINWDNSNPVGDTWEKSNDPSPVGWRVPTLEEIQKLLDTEKVTNAWTTVNGVNGRKFIDNVTGDSLFLPIAGYRYYRDGPLYDASLSGLYWSSTVYEDENWCQTAAHHLRIRDDQAIWAHNYRRGGFCVRSVADSSPGKIIDAEICKEKTPLSYFSIIGIRLQKEPQSGIYIIVYENGTTEKVMRNTQ